MKKIWLLILILCGLTGYCQVNIENIKYPHRISVISLRNNTKHKFQHTQISIEAYADTASEGRIIISDKSSKKIYPFSASSAVDPLGDRIGVIHPDVLSIEWIIIDDTIIKIRVYYKNGKEDSYWKLREP